MERHLHTLERKIASLRRQEPQPASTTKWTITSRFRKILGTTSVIRSIQTHEMLSNIRLTDHDFLAEAMIS